MDIKPRSLPIALSLSSEFYANSRDPSHSYEISKMYSANLLYMRQLFDFQKAHYFVGGGIGRRKVPRGEDDPGKEVKCTSYNLEAGIHVKIYKLLGFYGTVKYLYAQKKENNIKVIDFKESIILLGVTLKFSL